MTDPITVSVKEFCVLSGLCRDKVFALIKDGEIDSFKCGRLRLVSVESYRRWEKRQGASLADARRTPYKPPPPAIDLIRAEATLHGLDFGSGLDFVYFAISEEGQKIKIGKSANPAARIAALRCSSPVDIRLIGAIPGNMAIEKLIHAHFANERSQGEWFRSTERLIGFIEQALHDHGATDGVVLAAR
jgi:hypothetical protein